MSEVKPVNLLENGLLTVLSFVVLLAASGCIIKYTPEILPLDPELIDRFEPEISPGVVRVEMGKASSEEVFIADAYSRVWTTSMERMSQAVVLQLEGAMRMAGAPVNDSGEKTLTVVANRATASSSTQYASSFATFSCTVEVQVLLGDGEGDVFVGKGRESMNAPTCFNHAVSDVVVRMMKSKKIRAYIEK